MNNSDTNLLLLEGPDDIGVIYHLFRYHQIPVASPGRLETGKITLENGNGVNQILTSLKVRLKIQDSDTAVNRLGIIIDANMHLEARWQSLRRILRDAGYSNIPEFPLPEGTIINEDGLIIFGVWLMPDNQVPGKLENFIQFLVKPDDKLWDQAEECIKQIPVINRRFSEQDLIKAQVHTWLAWQEEPGKPMGQAITKKYLDADAPYALELINWIHRLFSFG